MASSTSRRTLATAAYARVAPGSSPAIVQNMTASQTASGSGIRKERPTSWALDPSNFRSARRRPEELSTRWIDPGLERAGLSYEIREGYSLQFEGARPSSSNVRSSGEGNSSHALLPPLWFGNRSRSLPDPSQLNQVVSHVRSSREGNSSLFGHATYTSSFHS